MNILTPVLTDQMMIQAVIDAEAKYFVQDDYENWAACMLQTSFTYYAHTPFFANENKGFEAFGWAEISEKVRRKMSNLSEATSYPQTKSHFQYNIIEDMAFVDFLINGEQESSCVLEKTNGKWLILRMNT